MSGSCRPAVSVVLATHNRREVVEGTLLRLGESGLARSEYEVIVVDNASTDGTEKAVAGLADRVVRLRRNRGSCAKSYGVEHASGGLIMFLDDDSFPQPGSLGRMIGRFESDPRLGAAGFVVHLPNGQQEGSALTGVFLGCGVGLRAEALRAVGGLDLSLFMQAEEYDLAFRLVSAGWGVRIFDDLHVEHLKSSGARMTERTTFYDTCNNLRIVSRYLPDPYHRIYRHDWVQRYGWLARRHGHDHAFRRGTRTGRWRGAIERWSYRRNRLSPEVLEHFFRWAFVRRRMAELARTGVRNAVFADLGKNIYAFFQAARREGVSILAIGDDRFAAPGRRYRGVAVVPLEQALNRDCDAVVVSNAAGVFAAKTEHRVRGRVTCPVYSWFSSPAYATAERCDSSTTGEPTDEISRRRACRASG